MVLYYLINHNVIVSPYNYIIKIYEHYHLINKIYSLYSHSIKSSINSLTIHTSSIIIYISHISLTFIYTSEKILSCIILLSSNYSTIKLLYTLLFNIVLYFYFVLFVKKIHIYIKVKKVFTNQLTYIYTICNS